ncbi:MAG: hypothetical protein ABIG89_02380 [Candidatus Woesearchaeota archaeon]
MNIPEKIRINGNLMWNDGTRLIKFKKELRYFMPSLVDRSKNLGYDMELFFKEDALEARVKNIVKNKETLPILVFLKEI